MLYGMGESATFLPRDIMGFRVVGLTGTCIMDRADVAEKTSRSTLNSSSAGHSPGSGGYVPHFDGGVLLARDATIKYLAFSRGRRDLVPRMAYGGDMRSITVIREYSVLDELSLGLERLVGSCVYSCI